MRYKAKTLLQHKGNVKNPDKWLKTKLKLLVGHQRQITDMRRVLVPKKKRKGGQPAPAPAASA